MAGNNGEKSDRDSHAQSRKRQHQTQKAIEGSVKITMKEVTHKVRVEFQTISKASVVLPVPVSTCTLSDAARMTAMQFMTGPKTTYQW